MNFMQQVKRMALCCSILQIYRSGFGGYNKQPSAQIPFAHNRAHAGMPSNMGNDGLLPLFS